MRLTQGVVFTAGWEGDRFTSLRGSCTGYFTSLSPSEYQDTSSLDQSRLNRD